MTLVTPFRVGRRMPRGGDPPLPGHCLFWDGYPARTRRTSVVDRWGRMVSQRRWSAPTMHCRMPGDVAVDAAYARDAVVEAVGVGDLRLRAGEVRPTRGPAFEPAAAVLIRGVGRFRPEGPSDPG